MNVGQKSKPSNWALTSLECGSLVDPRWYNEARPPKIYLEESEIKLLNLNWKQAAKLAKVQVIWNDFLLSFASLDVEAFDGANDDDVDNVGSIA